MLLKARTLAFRARIWTIARYTHDRPQIDQLFNYIIVLENTKLVLLHELLCYKGVNKINNRFNNGYKE